MNLQNFLKLNQGGVSCISIHQEPYNHEKNCYAETYFNESYLEDILESEKYKKIAKKKVDHFCIIGGGVYKVELCIHLKEREIKQ